MVTLKKVSKTELVSLVEIAYKNDDDLFEKYHVQKCNFEWAVISTLGMVHELSKERKVNYYKVIFKKEAIGYVVTFDNFLYSFGVAIKYRSKEVLSNYWKAIKEVLPKNFLSSLYINNERAINWLKKCGMKEVKINDNSNMVTFIN